MYDRPTPLERVLAAVDGAHWVRWDERTRRLFTWHPDPTRMLTVAVYDDNGVPADAWLLNPNGPVTPDAAATTVAERLNAGY